MNHEEVKLRLLKDPKVREAYENPPLPLATARTVVERRRELSITQKELAEMMGSSQAQVWRIESGQFNPTLKTLSKLEVALGTSLIPSEGVSEEAESEPLSPEEQLEEWIEMGRLVMDEESLRLALERTSDKELERIVNRIRGLIANLEEHEFLKVNLKQKEIGDEPTGEVDLAMTV